MAWPNFKKTRLAQSIFKLYAPYYAAPFAFKKFVIFISSGIFAISTQSALAASFPNPGQTETYTNTDNQINGQSESPLLLLNQADPTTMVINNTTLEVTNFILSGTSQSVIQLLFSSLNITTPINNGNIAFTNNQMTDGNVIFLQAGSTLTIEDQAVFSNNISKQEISNEAIVLGTIANVSSKTNIGNNARFDSNKAITNLSTLGGGAIFNSNGNVTIGNNATFINNSIDRIGGAISTFSNNGSDSIVNLGSGAQFISNTAGRYGGAIYNGASQLNLNLDNDTTTLFQGNTDQLGSNSIAFGTTPPAYLTTQTGSSGASATALLDMRDPMHSINNSDLIYITKNDNGVWALGGISNIRASTQFVVNAGTLYLYAQNEVPNLDPFPSMLAGTINLDNENGLANFTLASNASLVAGGDNSINLGSGNILIGDNATIRGGSQSRSLGGSTPRDERGGATSLTLTSENNTQLQGLVNLQALESQDIFTLNTNLVDAANSTGQMNKSGLGTLVVNSIFRYSGNTTITEGTWIMNGQLINNALTTVLPNGTLKGVGSLSNTTVNGTISPGNSIGTLTINGNYVQNPGSTYEVEINPAGESDLINITGTATINGGTVSVVKEAGNYTPQRYTILTAAGGRTGTYDALVQLMPFLDVGLTYDANNVYLDVSRSVNSFASFATTLNQQDTAIAVEQLGLGNPVYNALLNAPSVASAQQAFNTLSGELYSSLLSTFSEDSRYARQAVLQRLADRRLATRLKRFGHRYLWAQGYGSWGEFDATGNTATVNSKVQGFFIGADMAVQQHTLGVLAGYSNSRLDASARASSAQSDDYTLGLYSRHDFQSLLAKLGVTYTWHDVEMNRQAILPTFTESLSSEANGHTAQVFGQLDYAPGLTPLNLVPFVGATYVTSNTGRWQESGAAGLTGKNHVDTFYTHLGLQQAMPLRQSPGQQISERVMLAWRHAYSGVYPLSAVAFSGANPFAVQGAPIAEDALVIDAGLDADLPQRGLNLRLAYIGQVAEHVQDHGLTGKVSWQFD